MSIGPADLLRYLPDHKVVLCTSCEYALQPTGISRHLKDIHHILRSARKPFDDFVSHLDLDEPEAVMQSVDRLGVFPVSGLPVHQGLRCNREGCGHLCVTEKRMRQHWNAEHGNVDGSTDTWSTVLLQTFFKGNSLRYFTGPSSLIKQRLVGNEEDALMKHWIRHTSITLADDAPTKDDPLVSRLPIAPISLWQMRVPEMARTSDYLRYAILACSAVHLAYLHAAERQDYLIIAARYQELAIPLYRAEIAGLSDQNCNPILAFMHVLAICNFALEQEDERLLIADPNDPDKVSNWLAFLRSGCAFVDAVQPTILSGPLEGLLCNYTMLLDLGEQPDMIVVRRLLSAIPPPASDNIWSEAECFVYRSAVHELGLAFSYANRLGSRFNIWTALRVWPMIVQVDFFRMLLDNHPGAMILLAQYCILLQRLDSKWYANARARKLLSHILRRLHPKWHSYIDWSTVDVSAPGSACWAA